MYSHNLDEPPLLLQGLLNAQMLDLLDVRSDKPARRVEHDMLKDPKVPGYVAAWCGAKPEGRNLRAYFDAHVPDCAADILFADHIMGAMAPAIFSGVGLPELLAYIQDSGFVIDQHNANKLCRLLTAYMNALPCWANNGWSPNELHEQREVQQ